MVSATVLFALSASFAPINLVALRLYMGGGHEIEIGTSVCAHMGVSTIHQRNKAIFGLLRGTNQIDQGKAESVLPTTE